MLFGPALLLYYLCCLRLAGLTLFVALQGRRRTHTHRRLRRTFLLLALSLLLWPVTLFLEVRTPLSTGQLWLGRANSAAVVFAAYLALCFVQEVPAKIGAPRSTASRWLRTETGLLAVVNLLTPLVTAAERVEAGHAVITFGPLFLGYLLHVLGCLPAALATAFQGWRQAKEPKVRRKLALIDLGMLTTGGTSLVTIVLLPYHFGDFCFCDVETLSTLFFVLGVVYATFIYGLFDLQTVVRKALVYGALLAFVLGGYSSAVFLVTQYLTSGAEKLTQFAVLVIAFSFNPLRRFLAEKPDQLLLGERGVDGRRTKDPANRKRSRGGSPLTLALLFPGVVFGHYLVTFNEHWAERLRSLRGQRGKCPPLFVAGYDL